MKRKMCGVAIAVLAFVLLSGVSWGEEKVINIKIYKSLNEPGLYLCDSKGMTLYFFLNDSPGVSNCSGDCVTNWPLFYIAEPVLAPYLIKENFKVSDFSTINREDGKPQTAFKGWPLYYFAKDQKPGDILGKGVKDLWVLAFPKKLPAKK